MDSNHHFHDELRYRSNKNINKRSSKFRSKNVTKQLKNTLNSQRNLHITGKKFSSHRTEFNDSKFFKITVSVFPVPNIYSKT